MKKYKVSLTSKGSNKLIKPEELLIPLNAFVNMVDYLENLDDNLKKVKNKNEKFSSRSRSFSFTHKTHYINSKNEKDYVQIVKISHNSPYWMELILHTNPIVWAVVKIIVKEIIIESPVFKKKLNEILESFPAYNKLSKQEKDETIKGVIKMINVIMAFTQIDIDSE